MLVLVLSLADLLTVLTGLVGGLALEVGHMAWVGDSLGCQLYYFLTSWLLGLANFLVAALVSLLHVKRSTGWLARLAECRALLVLLTLATLLPALPELGLRSTVHLGEELQVCIISASVTTYGLYTVTKLVVLHVIPALAVLLSLVRPRTVVAKRLSALFLGAGCTCQTADHTCSQPGGRCMTPDLVTGLRGDVKQAKQSLVSWRGGGAATKLLPPREDPHRRCYKLLLSGLFLGSTLLYTALQVTLQVT